MPLNVKVMKQKKLLFSVTAKDCQWEFFRSGGPGGQNQNKVESGCRCFHLPSGARGEARDSRDQLRNRQEAFRRMAESPKFQQWIKLESSRVLAGHRSIEAMVEQAVQEQMQPHHLKVEVRNEEGWVEAK